MGKTYREFKGTKHIEKTRRKPKARKFMGFTSGNHTDKHYIAGSTRIENGKVVQDFEHRAPVKGKDFIKHGYPFATYPKHMVQAKKRGYHEEEN